MDSRHKKKHRFHAVSMILAISNDITTDKSSGYRLKFSNGMVEGKGITINSNGDVITFDEAGSYRLEMCGDGIVYSGVDVKIVYSSDKYPSGIGQFS